MNRSILLVSGAILLSVSLLAGCASGNANPNAHAASTEAITSPTATLIVHGMSCPLCANNVDAQLLDIKGVKSVDVDMGSGQVKVSFEPGATVTEAQLARAIDRSGFTLAGMSTP